jgi:CRP/FNR family transcriptional regulator, cyclic AMP receptor protein
MTHPLDTILLLDEDPELAAGLEAVEVEMARARSRAVVVDILGPRWDPTRIRRLAQPDWIGLFVVEGLMIRSVSVASRTSCELFGPGDLLRPWDGDHDYDPLPIAVSWRVPQAVRLAVLDSEFAQRMCRWPLVIGRIAARFAARARSLALVRAASHLTRADGRLLILFWVLCERWGTVGLNGVRVRLPLTHEVIAMLIGVRRPTVTQGLGRLARAGLLVREGSDRWLLTHAALDCLKEPERIASFQEPVGAGDGLLVEAPGEPLG